MPSCAAPNTTRRRGWALVLALAAGSAGTMHVAAREQPDRLNDVRAAVVVDDLHLDFIATGRLRTAVRTLVALLHQTGRLASLQTTGPSTVRLDVEADTPAWRIDDAVKHLTGNALHADDVAPPAGGPQWREVRDRAWQTATTVDAAIASSGRAVQRAVVLLSLGYRTDDAEVDRAAARIVERASVAGVAIVPVDPDWFDLGNRQGRLPDAAWRHHREVTRGSLRRLATDTGGTIWAPGEDAAAVFARLR